MRYDKSYDYNALREQGKKNAENLYYEQPATSVRADKTENDTLIDEYLTDLRALGATKRDEIVEYFKRRNLPWGLPSDNVIWWLEKKLNEED